MQAHSGRTTLVRHLGRGAAIAVLATGGIGVAASPAAAFPGQCSIIDHKTNDVKTGASSRCLSGTGRHMISVRCRGITGDQWKDGPWKNTGTSSGRRSTANCPQGTAMVSRFQTLSSS